MYITVRKELLDEMLFFDEATKNGTRYNAAHVLNRDAAPKVIDLSFFFFFFNFKEGFLSPFH
jgi:hypothetical protein